MRELKNRKETIREKVKGFYRGHELEFTWLGVYAVEVAVVVSGYWLGYTYAMRRTDSGLRRMFDVNPEFENVFLSTLKQLKEIDEKRNVNFKN